MEQTYKGHGISLTRSARPFYLFIFMAFLTGLFMYSHSWTTVTKCFFTLTVISLGFSIWFPYSPFVKMRLKITNENVYVGKYKYSAENIFKIVNEKQGIMIMFHIVGYEEPITVRMDEDYQKSATQFLEQWAKQQSISYDIKD